MRTGKSRVDQAEAQARQEEHAGLAKFDPEAVSHVLRDSRFFHYASMCRTIEGIPSKLAAYGEQCPCHSALLGRLSLYQRQVLMSSFYGEGVKNCPAAGMMGPELVGGLRATLFELALLHDECVSGIREILNQLRFS